MTDSPTAGLAVEPVGVVLVGVLRDELEGGPLPGPETAVLAVKRPARPYKSAIENRFTMENAKGAYTPRAGPDGAAVADAAGDHPTVLGLA